MCDYICELGNSEINIIAIELESTLFCSLELEGYVMLVVMYDDEMGLQAKITSRVKDYCQQGAIAGSSICKLYMKSILVV